MHTHSLSHTNTHAHTDAVFTSACLADNSPEVAAPARELCQCQQQQACSSSRRGTAEKGRRVKDQKSSVSQSKTCSKSSDSLYVPARSERPARWKKEAGKLDSFHWISGLQINRGSGEPQRHLHPNHLHLWRVYACLWVLSSVQWFLIPFTDHSFVEITNQTDVFPANQYIKIFPIAQGNMSHCNVSVTHSPL